jgi:hypothetical protein
MSQSTRLRNLSARVRLSTAMILRSAALVERLDEIRTNETGRAGDYRVHVLTSLECSIEFVAPDDRRTELADDDAGRDVRRMHRVGPARRHSQHHRQGGDHRVAGAGNVEHLARHRLLVQRAAA